MRLCDILCADTEESVYFKNQSDLTFLFCNKIQANRIYYVLKFSWKSTLSSIFHSQIIF